jgi:ATP-dependent phosphofructokinase / diphosphate-dependent phosphofructokinase
VLQLFTNDNLFSTPTPDKGEKTLSNDRRLGILTAGGDCPGMNAALRAVAKKAILEFGFEVIGIEDGYEGLIHNRCRHLPYESVSGILTLGGTILGTSNSADPYAYATKRGDKVTKTNRSRTVLNNIQNMGLEALVCIGGDGSMSIASRLAADGVSIVGVPKTIDDDVAETDVTIGFDTALSIATEAVDRVHTSAQSHHRVMIVEVMGRNAGWLALHAGIAGGGDIVLIPEIPYDINSVANRVKERNRRGKKFTIIVISEGAKPVGGQVVVKRIVKFSADPVRLGGISFVLADQIEEITGIETRALVLGHLLRGGTPSAADRVLATRLGTRAMDLISSHEYGYMVGIRADELVSVPLEKVANRQRTVPIDNPLIQSARSTGTCFGDN